MAERFRVKGQDFRERYNPETQEIEEIVEVRFEVPSAGVISSVRIPRNAYVPELARQMIEDEVDTILTVQEL